MVDILAENASQSWDACHLFFSMVEFCNASTVQPDFAILFLIQHLNWTKGINPRRVITKSEIINSK